MNALLELADHIAKEGPTEIENRCRDFDEDCAGIAAEGGCFHCWKYDPAQGICPYLTQPSHSAGEG